MKVQIKNLLMLFVRGIVATLLITGFIYFLITDLEADVIRAVSEFIIKEPFRFTIILMPVILTMVFVIYGIFYIVNPSKGEQVTSSTKKEVKKTPKTKKSK